jgi:hypothetical protein
MTHYVYIISEHNPEGNLYTVGFYDPQGNWRPEYDTDSQEEAAQRVHWLNGGCNQNCNCNEVINKILQWRNKAELQSEGLLSDNKMNLVDYATYLTFIQAYNNVLELLGYKEEK